MKILIAKTYDSNVDPGGGSHRFATFNNLAVRLAQRCFVSCFLLLSVTNGALAIDRIAVIYPEVSSPYKAIFQTILEGIQSQKTAEYRLYSLSKKHDLIQLRSRLEAAQVNGIIALGKRGYLTVQQLDLPLPTIVGALPLIPNGVSGISLSTEPEQLFSQLKLLVPDAKQVFVVYSPKANAWLLPYAEKAAQKNNLQLEAFAAEDMRETMHLYRQLLKNARGRSIAIWLPLDKLTANEDIVLPMLLQEAWNKNLVICSSKPTHVQRGALFSMYPDNFGLGEELAKTIQQQKTQGKTGVIPLKRLHLAVNMRTAAHLGLSFSSKLQQKFNLTFPAR